ncbi:MAG: adenosylcobalamin-dependent ribonucleoside-diphosphate reductase [Candidatus Daviesbacteria bacterium]|nr:adenosylcobalamin-dependent ribonucleoside-diphosphate reductase [Candidatus Daviesbacteria bacterium]
MAKKLKNTKSKVFAQQVNVIPKSERHVSPKLEISAVPENPTLIEGLQNKIFLDRYAWKDEKGNPMESVPDQMWSRVARAIAHVEKTPKLQKEWEEKFFYALSDFKFLPGGRILSAAGTGYEVTYYNCFVIPSPPDSRGGIIDNLKIMTEMLSRAGGVGINLSTLRPSGARVHKVNGTSSGPVNWANLYSVACHDVIQQGGSRRGALMLMLHDWHPDIELFIEAKKDLTQLAGANLSVCLSDTFMEAVENDADWTLRFPDHKHPQYDLEWDGDLAGWEAKGYPVVDYRTVKAKDVWNKICQLAWASAEPGLHFLERSNKQSNTWYFEKLVCTNPCGEQPLGPWAVCNLGSINLSAFVEDEVMNYESLAEHVAIAVRFLDNVIDDNYYFYPENEAIQKNVRRIGLGTMGLGDALIKMKVKYGSPESLEIIEKIYKTVRDNAYQASSDIALEKGSFPKFNKEKYLQGYFIKQLPENIRESIEHQGIRNAVLLTQAPTGTTSLLAGVSSGIEPVFDFAMKRKDRTGESIIYHPLFKAWKDENEGIEIPPDYFAGANDLTPDDHILVQATVQKYTDASISKTVNAQNNHTVEDVQKLYMDAYKLGCKGITYMRDGSREGVLTHINENSKQQESTQVQPVHRPMVLSGRTYEILTPVGKAFITINQDENGVPMEIFITVGKTGMHTGADAEALGRLISIALRVDTNKRLEVAEKIVNQLRGIGGSSHIGFGKERVMSLADAVAKVMAEDLSHRLSNSAKSVETMPLNLDSGKTNGVDHSQMSGLLPFEDHTSKSGDLCPECGQATFVFEEGCKKCHNCGHSMC